MLMPNDEKKNNPHNPFVTVKFCDERFLRIIDKLTQLHEDIAEIKVNSKQKGRDWRMLGFTILGGIITAILTAGILGYLNI